MFSPIGSTLAKKLISDQSLVHQFVIVLLDNGGIKQFLGSDLQEEPQYSERFRS